VEQTTEHPIAVTQGAGQRAAEALSLVLSAEGVDHVLRRSDEGWRLWVSSEDAESAREILAAYRSENRAAGRRPAPPPLYYGRTTMGIALGAGLALFFAVTGPRDLSVRWFRVGAADASAILAGEGWRTATALTLHADLGHLAGNVLSASVFVTALAGAIGPGVAAWLLLAAGVGGNALCAVTHGPGHSSVGASTAIFGAIGALAGLQLARRRALDLARRRAWVPVAAGLGLLAMLGTGARADVLAHLYGLLVGLVGGALAGALARPPGALVQWILLGLALATLLASWQRALV